VSILRGRNSDGRFTTGNPGGPGNPHSAQVQALSSALLEAVTPEDIAEVVTTLLTSAKSGDIAAAKVLLDRCLGRVTLANVDGGEEPQVGWWESLEEALSERKAEHQVSVQDVLYSPCATEVACQMAERLDAEDEQARSQLAG